MKLLRRNGLALLLSVVTVACERHKAPPPSDSVALPSTGVRDSSNTAASNSWDPSAGQLLLIMADAPSRAFVVLPDSATAAATLGGIPRPASVTLFGRSGSVQNAELPTIVDSGVCTVASLNAAPPPRAWNVGFIGGVVAPIAMDSIASIPRADSATLVAWADRLASTMPNDSAGRFTGLPFIVRELWRFSVPNGPQVVIANLVRQINQEATPLQERTFLIAEHAANDTTYALAYGERSYGVEETIESRDVVAAVALGGNRNAAIIIARDYGDAIAYGLIERGDDKRWRRRWASTRRHC